MKVYRNPLKKMVEESPTHTKNKTVNLTVDGSEFTASTSWYGKNIPLSKAGGSSRVGWLETFPEVPRSLEGKSGVMAGANRARLCDGFPKKRRPYFKGDC